ncbi:MAG: 16S rRNA (guanine(527)-N(7))-methyltransferase RsmG [Defluviitaleaceae bacterium]|nr:16S rRNA (guanine(527)-N(7))-methyltransferase RsmG [Defluviitaleaceae bacterium]
MQLKLFLEEEAAELGVRLDNQAIDQLWAYKDFLKEYNEKVNLTAITDDEGIVTKHFLDCLTILPYLGQNSRVVDVGTGPGFPGLVAKIARPDLDLTLIDARGKKVKFLEEAAQLLGLEGVSCIHDRAEDRLKVPGYAKGFDYAVSRAVAAMDKLAGWCLPFVKPGGQFIAMKGPNFQEELDAGARQIAKLGGKVDKIVELNLPSDLTRNLIIISRR